MTKVEINYRIEWRLPGGAWQSMSLPIYSLADARDSLAHTWAYHPDQFFRLVKRTTTTEVVDV